MPKIERFGRYRIFFWNAIDPDTGHSGWVVQRDAPGEFSEIISKHNTKEQARANAARYDVADIRRGKVEVKL